MAKKLKNEETPICKACNGTGSRNFGPICPTCEGSGREAIAIAEPDAERPVPPTLDEVIAAGYSPEVSASIVAQEIAKAEAGEPPYGDKAITEAAGAE